MDYDKDIEHLFGTWRGGDRSGKEESYGKRDEVG